jgi:hypothetical protein
LPVVIPEDSPGATTMQERRTEWGRRARFDEVKRDVADRIRHLVDAMPTEEVDALLRRMTLVQLKYEVAEHPRIR